MAPEVRLLPEYLDAVGCHSRAFVTNPNVLPVWGFGRGFDEFHDVQGADGAARADEINEAVFESLRENRHEPFFLYVHTVDPHAPYEPPQLFRARFPQPPAEDLESQDPALAARARLTDTIAQAGSASGRPFFLDLDLTGVTLQRNVVSGVVWGGYKLLDLSQPTSGVLMFDLLADPGELESVAWRRRALVASLRHRIAEHRAASVHLWPVNANDEGSRRVEGALLATGRFSALPALQLEAGDEAELSADARRLVFRLELRNLPNPIGEPPWRIVDQDRLVVSVEPPDAAIEIESLEFDGSPAPLFLGAGSRPASVPMVLDPTSPGLRVVHMATLFPATQEASSVAPLGAYLGVVERGPAPIVHLDSAVEERLRALRYAQ